MSTLSALPVELVLLVVEHAAWSEITANKRWVGSLRLVSRRFDTTIKTIYFHTLFLRRRNRNSIAKLAQLPGTPLSLTRHIIFPGNYEDNDLSEESFYASSANLRDFTGSFTQLQTLGRIYPTLSLDSVFLTSPIDARSMYWLSPIPRVHMVNYHWQEDLFALGDSDSSLRDAQIRWIIVDVFSSHTTRTAVDFIAQFLSDIAGLLKLPLLERLLLRPRLEHEGSHDAFCDAARHWAIGAHDERIWLDGTSVQWDITDVDAWDVADALTGHGLWLTGAELYQDRSTNVRSMRS